MFCFQVFKLNFHSLLFKILNQQHDEKYKIFQWTKIISVISISLSSGINSSVVQKISNETTCTPKNPPISKGISDYLLYLQKAYYTTSFLRQDFFVRTLYQAGSGWYLQVDLHCHPEGWRKLDDLEAVSLVAWGGSMWRAAPPTDHCRNT